MARNEITTPLDLSNLENHNKNYEELYGLIGESDKRLSEAMWEDLKEHNTLKMLEPVSTKSELPKDARDKSLITVLDEQKVYARVNSEWQPFSEIDIDPFSPFKEELATMISEHEQKANQLLIDAEKEHTDAVAEINKLVSDFNADYKTKSGQLKSDYDSYTSSINKNKTDSLSAISDSKESSLSDIEKARQDALASLNNENTDNWQKYKLTSDDGSFPLISLGSDTEALHQLEPGNYYTTSTPIDMASSTAGFTSVVTRGDEVMLKHIIFRPYNSNQMFIKRFYNEWFDWEPMAGTRVELYDGSAKANGDKVYLKVPYDRFTELKIKFNRTGGTIIRNFDAESSSDISINTTNVYNDGSEGKMYELILSKTTTTELTVASQVTRTFGGVSSQDAGIEVLKVWGLK
ncbi:hypothetical protein [Staphylococcus gallinarum]|uniref:hypothetical protein n=1 Tax=Staphylococcus gallinarum TaxID=1293 RepID=UPI0030BF1E0D